MDAKLPTAQRAQIVDILAAADNNAGRAFLKALQSDLPAEVRDKIIANLKLFLPGKWRELRQSKELAQVIGSLLNRPESQATGLLLIGASEKLELLPEVQGIAAERQVPSRGAESGRANAGHASLRGLGQGAGRAAS